MKYDLQSIFNSKYTATKEYEIKEMLNPLIKENSTFPRYKSFLMFLPRKIISFCVFTK